MNSSIFTQKRHIGFQVLILILIVLLPLHFYIQSEKENIELKAQKSLQIYANKVANSIYKFSNSNETEFFFPRSNIYKSAIYTIDKKLIFSLFPKPINLDDLQNSKKYSYYIFNLKDNIFNASYLLVAKKKDYAQLIVNVVAILSVTVMLVFLAIFSIIKQSQKPYKELNKYLENFMKDAMHELKTPMGVMLLNLDGLSSIYKDNKMIKRAKSALKNMIVIYEDLEFFVKNKQIKHPKQTINLSNFCHERVNFFSDLLEQKKIEVIKNIQDNININFSPIELSRIIDNTLSNAIKYSKSNTKIKINLRKNSKQIILSIIDEGRGIKDTKKIFNRYYRGDRISGGFGIGLNIVKQICNNNGIKIEVKSKEQEGTEFKYIFSIYI